MVKAVEVLYIDFSFYKFEVFRMHTGLYKNLVKA